MAHTKDLSSLLVHVAKKTKEERIAEKKAKRRAEEQVPKQGREEGEPLSLEEQTAEKLRLQQVQQNADLEVTKELFGGAAFKFPLKTI